MKLLYTTLITCLTISLSFGQAVKKPLLTKRTATWCPNCGAWGWTFFKDVIDISEDKALVIATHFSGDLENDLNRDIANVFGGSGQPQFFLNGVNVGANSNNNADKLTQIMDDLELINAEEAEFAAAIDASYQPVGDDVSITADISISPTASLLDDGTYSAGVYLIRDDVAASQAGQSGIVDHFKILVASFSDGSFGEEFTGNEGYTGSLNLTYTPSIDMERSEIGLIIWKVKDGAREVVTTEVDNTIAFVSSSSDQDITKLTWSITADNTIYLQADQVLTSTAIYDLSGRIIQQQNQNTKDVELAMGSLPTGHYVLRVVTENGEQQTIKIALP